MKKWTAAIAVVVLASGCSSGPGEADMRRALTESLNKEMFAQEVEFKSFEVGDCVKTDATYACPLKGEAIVKMRVMEGRTMTQDFPFAGTYRFAEMGGKWAIVGVQ